MELIFEKLCGLACYELFTIADELEQIYTEEEIGKLKEAVEVVREDQYLEDVFGDKAALDKNVWLDKMNTIATWVFDSSKIRDRLLEAAEIEVKHK